MICWSASPGANCPRVWTINPDAWGNDIVVTTPADLFQPILFADQYKDEETTAWLNDGAMRHRPGLVLSGYRTYDAWTGSYLQVDPMVNATWSTYVYASSDPVSKGSRLELISLNDHVNGAAGISDTILQTPAPDHSVSERRYMRFMESHTSCHPVFGSLPTNGTLDTTATIPLLGSRVRAPTLAANQVCSTFLADKLYEVTCDAPCGVDINDASCVVVSAGQWAGYSFKRTEVFTTVPGVHLNDDLFIGLCECSCSTGQCSGACGGSMDDMDPIPQ